MLFLSQNIVTEVISVTEHCNGGEGVGTTDAESADPAAA